MRSLRGAGPAADACRLLVDRRAVIAGLLGATAAVALPALPAAAAGETVSNDSASDPTAIIWARINDYRQANGRPALPMDCQLSVVATGWSQRMASQDQLSHNGARDAEYGWPTSGVSEVVSKTSGGDLTTNAHRVVDAWIASPGHRGILLGSHTDMGIGWAVAGNGAFFATGNFISVELPGAGQEALSLSRELIADQSAERVVIVRDDLAADALSAAALVDGNTPLFLARAESGLPPVLREEIARAVVPGGTVYLVGGGLPDDMLGQIEGLGARPVRLRGASRYETSALVAREVMAVRGTPWRILLVTGEGWADAVSAGAFAARHGTPLLLTPADQMHPAAAAVLADLPDADRVVIGGPSAVHDSVANAAGAWRITGDDRADTGSNVMTDAWGTHAEPGSALLVTPGWTEDGWATALAHSTFAARHGAPLLFAGDDIPAAVAQAVSAAGFGSAAPAALRFGHSVSQSARAAFIDVAS